MSITVYCTYCSAKKNPEKKPIQAIKRYVSRRINFVAKEAQSAQSMFMILSGKYGLIDAHQMIPDYDHLLIEEELEAHSAVVAAQLKNKNIGEIIFYMGNTRRDRKIKPYAQSMIMACKKANTTLEIRSVSENE